MIPHINPEIKKLPYRIWYQIRDNEGNVLSTGAHLKTYIRYVNALSVAKNQYGGNPNVEWCVAKIDPFQDHTDSLTCELCQSGFSSRMADNGYRITSRISLKNDGYTVYDRLTICPECYLSIVEHIKGLVKEKKKDEYSEFE